MMYNLWGKRFIDVFFSLCIILILSPLIFIVYILLALSNNGNAIFKQKRPGKNAGIFEITKFKTMNDKKDIHGKLLPDYQRITRFGKIVRTMSLDELPQLFNVLKGEMSLIGPRPLLVKYLERYTPEQARRHEVRPGITGWAQVNGRNAISWEEKFKLDVWYVDNMSLALDLKIIWLTLIKVLKRSDIISNTTITMEEFKGDVELNRRI